MRSRRFYTWMATVAALVMGVEHADAQSLGVPAPGLDVAWVKGGPVNMAAGRGRAIYVVEFWATWCGPCRASIPHLTQLQRTYGKRGLVVVGVSEEAMGTVQQFVTAQGDKMDYTVAVDRNGRTSAAYMGAFGVGGIPHAFLIDSQGAIVWHGHPQDLDKVLEEAIGTVFNFAGAMPLEQAGDAFKKYFDSLGKYSAAKSEIQRKQISDQARQMGQNLLTTSVGDIKKLNTLSWHIMMLEDAKARDLDLAGKAADAALAASQQKPADRMRKDIHDYFRTVLPLAAQTDLDADTKKNLVKFASGLFRANEPGVLSEFARAILTAPALNYRDLDLAVRMAKAATTKTHGRDPVILDTYALAMFKTGKAAAAIELVRKAIEQTKDEEVKNRLQKSLEEYRGNAGSSGARGAGR